LVHAWDVVEREVFDLVHAWLEWSRVRDERYIACFVQSRAGLVLAPAWFVLVQTRQSTEVATSAFKQHTSM
jgi:hypothetical protein